MANDITANNYYQTMNGTDKALGIILMQITRYFYTFAVRVDSKIYGMLDKGITTGHNTEILHLRMCN